MAIAIVIIKLLFIDVRVSQPAIDAEQRNDANLQTFPSTPRLLRRLCQTKP
jgi:hypothetical protein